MCSEICHQMAVIVYYFAHPTFTASLTVSLIISFTGLNTWAFCLHITKTHLYNFDPLKPHFYIVKLGFTGVYFIFHISAENIDCGYSLELPRQGSSNEYPQSMFSAGQGGSNEYPQSMFSAEI